MKPTRLMTRTQLGHLARSLLPAFFAAVAVVQAGHAQIPTSTTEVRRLETGAASTMPLEWIDRDTGHRVVRISRRDGASRSFYFHNNPFIPGRAGEPDRMVYYGNNRDGGSQLFVLDLNTLSSEQLTPTGRRISGEILSPFLREVFYQSRDTVFATNVDTRVTRVVFVFPAGYDGAIASVNTDGTLLAGVRSVPEKRAVTQANPGRTLDAIFEAHLPHTLFTIDIANGKLTEVHGENAWLNHVQFSPTDPQLIMFCHEGPWHLLDRIWTIDLRTGEVTKIHTRTVNREIAGHEFFSRDGRTIWYDLQVPRGETFFLASADIATGTKRRYALTRDEWSIHFNISPDQRLFAGDGGDSSQVAGAWDGMWLYLFRPEGDRLVSERLVNMRHHDYELEPNVHFSPDGRWVIFRANFEGESQVYAVSVERERSTGSAAGATQPSMRAGGTTGPATASGFAADASRLGPLDWPQLTSTTRPWTRWWWQGSAVTDAALTQALEAYRAAGLGGVEITPIYGVAGYEKQFIDYLSPTWIRRLEHTLREAGRLGLGVDLATGTGWPFGGSMVGDAQSAKYVAFDTFHVRGGERLRQPVRHRQEPLLRAIGNRLQLPLDSATDPLQRAGRERLIITDLRDPVQSNPYLQALALEQARFPKPLPLLVLMAYSDQGDVRDLTARVRADGSLNWTAPAGEWTLYALFQGWHGKLVERAAPGGEGPALDHFSEAALYNYLATFSRAFAGHDVSALRAFFNDSYEVDDAQGEADWTPAFFDEFQWRRGYDLLRHLPALFGAGDSVPADGSAGDSVPAPGFAGARDPATASRVLTDYRETISDLLLDEFTKPWAEWAHGQQAQVRDQAHGSPANILDLYAASDIPETEGTDILRFKSATSAAHVSGKPLASAEAATWLNEHFLSTFAEVKRALDRYFLGGVNQIVYHGTAYSPPEAPWPGWLFYAAVHFQPTNPLWPDFRALNDYVARAQSLLQAGQPANDVLLYLPVHDRWAVRDRTMLVHFDGSMAPFAGMTVADDARQLQERGYAFDFISDRQVLAARAGEGEARSGSGAEATDATAGGGEAPAAARGAPAGAAHILTGGNSYRAIVVPGAHLLPLETLQQLLALARAGATVIFHGQMPDDVPGLHYLAARQATFHATLASLRFSASTRPGVQEASVGTGRVLLGPDLEPLLASAGVRREPVVDTGLQFVRRRIGQDVVYFIANWSDDAVDGWIPFADTFPAAALLDPMTGETGVAQVRVVRDSTTGVQLEPESTSEVRLELAPGQSVIVRAHPAALTGPAFGYYEPAGAPQAVTGTWQLRFIDGGPTLPAPLQLDSLKSWTELGREAGRDFSGRASYTLTFPRPGGPTEHWRLDLGTVHESAKVRLNGQELGTLIGPAFGVTFDASLLRDRNELEITVANLMANRIAAMDRQQVHWKRFYNVNFPANQRANSGSDGLFDASRWEPRPSGLLGPVTLTPLRRD